VLVVIRAQCLSVISYSLPATVESATDAAPLAVGDWTSIAPLLICAASCECVGDAPLSATPPSISVSDILRRVLSREVVLAVLFEAENILGHQKVRWHVHADLRDLWHATFIACIVAIAQATGLAQQLCRHQYASGASPSFPLMLLYARLQHHAYCAPEPHYSPHPPPAMRQHRRGRAW
jgi:hypothetical protein